MSEYWANIRSNRSRVYVNPCIVKCAAAYSSISDAAVPKKIHINPNFKGPRTFLQNDKAQDLCSVHINPYFDRAKLSWTGNDQLGRSSLHSNSELKEIVSGDDLKNGGSSYKLNTCTRVGCNTNACHFDPSSQSAAASKLMAGNVLSLHTNEISQNIHKFGKSLDIKTRHKIVHIDNFQSVPHNNENSDRKLLHRYKIINIKKSKGDDQYKSTKNYQNLDFSLQSNVQEEKRKKIFAEKLQLKLKYGLRRTSYVNKITNSIKTKYIYPNKMWQRKKSLGLLKNSKHKLDKREVISGVSKRNSGLSTYGSRKKVLYTNLEKYGRIKTVSFLWKLPLSKNKYHNHFIWRKREKSQNDVTGIKKVYPNRSVVKIGGIMYKSSSNKLTLAKEKKREVRIGNDEIFSQSKNKHQIVYVRGEKFLLDWTGKTIIRQSKLMNASDGNKFLVRRIDLGGVTFIQKSNNVLIRTNTHQARQLVHSAKQRSIALLHRLRKRNNMPCMIYQKYGICSRNNKGMCIYVHNPKNIDLCKKFLKGECHNINCLLSHDAIKEKMATCHFFLQGKCNKENCQYLHVKVNKKAAICKEFLRGFCNLGQNCTKRHVHRCPEFDEKGICSRGANCSYPHKRSRRKKTKTTMFGSSKRRETSVASDDKKEKTNSKPVKKNSLRIKFEDSKKKKMKADGRRFELTDGDETENDSVVECIPKRVQLTDLPLFIPLNIE